MTQQRESKSQCIFKNAISFYPLCLVRKAQLCCFLSGVCRIFLITSQETTIAVINLAAINYRGAKFCPPKKKLYCQLLRIQFAQFGRGRLVLSLRKGQSMPIPQELYLNMLCKIRFFQLIQLKPATGY